MSNDQVYVGLWTNWSSGRILGATLTLAQRDATLLIAFVAFFVALVGNRLWRIVCTLAHICVFSSKGRPDGLYHQRQAFLRNASNAESGIVTVLCLGWAWRKAPATWPRILPLISFVVLWIAAWVVATGFSSRVANTGQVLLSGTGCGAITNGGEETNLTDIANVVAPFLTNLLQESANYARECYNSNETNGALGCNLYIRKDLKPQVITNASCPFQESICRSHNTNLIIDTGLVDVRDDFGLNIPSDQTFQYRRVLHCAPLVTNGYITTYNLSSDRSYSRYWYGENLGAGVNWTNEFSNDANWEILSTTNTAENEDYGITNIQAFSYNGSLEPTQSSLQPISELARKDADVFLFFLVNNGIVFTSPVNDPWFNATKPFGNITVLGSQEAEIYIPGEPASPLACTEQEQICNPNLPGDDKCTPLSSTWDLLEASDKLFESEAALNRLHWIYYGPIQTSALLYVVPGLLGAQSLRAREGLGVGVQGPLPDNQWQLEIQHWHATCMANIQAFFVLAASGLNDGRLKHWSRGPNNTEESILCGSQRILSTAYISFSAFALFFILVVGSIIVVFSWALGPCLAWLRRRLRWFEYQELEWSTNETFQLQRMAYEGVGIGTWFGATDTIPTTKPGELLATLDVTDRGHPRLSAPVQLVQVDPLDKE